MYTIKYFLFANVPLSAVHFLLFLFTDLGGILGQPGHFVAGLLGCASEGLLWWAVMVVNSLFWGGVITVIVLPFLRRLISGKC